jgi:hypothetical protein
MEPFYTGDELGYDDDKIGGDFWYGLAARVADIPGSTSPFLSAFTRRGKPPLQPFHFRLFDIMSLLPPPLSHLQEKMMSTSSNAKCVDS